MTDVWPSRPSPENPERDETAALDSDSLASVAQLLEQAESLSTATPQSSQTLQKIHQLLNASLEILEGGDFQARWEVAKVFPLLGDWAIAPLVNILRDEAGDWELRWFTARILGGFQQPQVMTVLVELLKTTSDPELTAIAATTLASFGTPAIPALTKLLEEPDLRLVVVRTLGQIRTPETLGPLLQGMQDTQIAVRLAALEALSSFHDPRAAEALMQSLQDPVSLVRREAVIGLGFRGDLWPAIDLVGLLRDRLYDLNEEVCRQAAISLGRLGTEAALPVLLEVLRSPLTPVSLQLDVVRALGWMNTPASLQALGELLDPSQVQRDAPWTAEVLEEIVGILGRVDGVDLKPQALQSLLTGLQTTAQIAPSPRLKQLVALALGQLGDLQALDALLQLLLDPEESVQIHALTAIKRLPLEPTRDRLQSLLQQSTLPEALRLGIFSALAELEAAP